MPLARAMALAAPLRDSWQTCTAGIAAHSSSIESRRPRDVQELQPPKAVTPTVAREVIRLQSGADGTGRSGVAFRPGRAESFVQRYSRMASLDQPPSTRTLM